MPHLVVFDVNVYLDAARATGEPFTFAEFDRIVAAHGADPVPSRSKNIDSLRAIATTLSGRFVGQIPLEVWTSDHIDVLTATKASHPVNAQIDEDRGLGWSRVNSQALVDHLIAELCFPRSNGGSVGRIPISYGTPPLSHEDGTVYATARDAGATGVLYERFCVTRDKEFRLAALPGEITVLYPHEWVAYCRRAKSIVGSRALRGQPPAV